MPSKSTATAAVSDDAIRTRAYLLWEADGRPFGQDGHYWGLAAAELTTPATPKAAAAKAATASKIAKPKTAAKPVKAAAKAAKPKAAAKPAKATGAKPKKK
jgi:hypothetical protein